MRRWRPLVTLEPLSTTTLLPSPTVTVRILP
uniref:Uncharacterized protein n=1 Tax=Arundo donax TaxID=35708 RepID=A0A0A9ARB7_ARUDO